MEVVMGLFFILLVAAALAGSIGFVIGYFFGRRSGATARQPGFPVLPTPSASQSVEPGERTGRQS